MCVCVCVCVCVRGKWVVQKTISHTKKEEPFFSCCNILSLDIKLEKLIQISILISTQSLLIQEVCDKSEIDQYKDLFPICLCIK